MRGQGASAPTRHVPCTGAPRACTGTWVRVCVHMCALLVPSVGALGSHVQLGPKGSCITVHI